MEIRIQPDGADRVDPELAQRLIELAIRACGMGLLPDDTIARLDAASIRQLLDAFRAHGLLQADSSALNEALLPARLARPSPRATALMDRLLGTIEHAPLPATEWPLLRQLLGDALLCGLTNIAPASLRRYAAGERSTPLRVAERLHFIAMLVSDLAGGYNDFGMRRWFARPRTALGGRTPAELLRGEWSVDGPAVREVRLLAAAVSGARLPPSEDGALARLDEAATAVSA